MLRAVRTLAAHCIDGPFIDAVVLDEQGRRACRGPFAGIKGTRFTVELAEPAILRGGDALVLETGDLVEVIAKAEPLIEVRMDDCMGLARIAWTLGDRHVPVQIVPDCIRLRPDATLEALLCGLGAQLAAIETPFDPEGGAYLSTDPSHAHRHRHDDHRHHDHGGCDHDPGHQQSMAGTRDGRI
jgi:urease accessory protein